MHELGARHVNKLPPSQTLYDYVRGFREFAMNAAARRLHRRRLLMRRFVRAGVIVAVASAGLLALAHSGAPVLVNIPGATAAPRGADVVALRASPDQPRTEKNPPKKPQQSPKLPAEITGDARLRPWLELERAELKDGRYVVWSGTKQFVLTLDPEIQAAAEAALARAKAPRGAIVVMDVDGAILALAGHRGGDRGRAPKFGRDLDVALSVWAPAASVFKVVTAAALVTAGVRPDKKVCYHGGLRSVEASNLRDDRARDGACGTLTDGVSRSQNAIMAKLSHRYLKPAKLREMARVFGFGQGPQFALDVEQNRAAIPSGGLDFARVAAGFWHTELSPLGGVLVANTVASGGKAVTPRIVAEVIEGNRTTAVKPAPAGRAITKRVATQVAQMMTATTRSGTAYKGFHDRKRRPFLPGVAVAGKTGTLVRAQPSYLEYSWFVGFAPTDKPQVSISVLLGNPPRWHLKAHTAARMVLQAVF